MYYYHFTPFLHSSTNGVYNNDLLFQLKADYFQLLKDTPDIDRHSRWNDVKHKIDSDPRYIAIDSNARREDWFKEFIRNQIVSVANSLQIHSFSVFQSKILIFFLLLHKKLYSRFSSSRPCLSRITAYLEVKFWSLF